MARNNKNPLNVKRITSLLQNINNGMENIYKDTYNSSKTNLNDIEKITSDIEDNVLDIINRNGETDISNISKLYSRMKLQTIGNDKDLKKAVEEIFEDDYLTNNLMSTYVGNKWMKELDTEIDTILKYMPKLQEALNAKRDAVLSSDNFEKDFLNCKCIGLSAEDASIFSKNMESLKTKYDLLIKVKKWYDLTSKYGECFIYCVPYSKEIAKLLKNKGNTRFASNHLGMNLHEDVTIPIMENGIICKGMVDSYDTISKINKEIANGSNITVTFSNGYYLESAMNNLITAENISKSLEGASIYESFINEAYGHNKKFDQTIDDDLEFPEKFDSVSADGVINTAMGDKNTDLKIPGALIKKLERENLIPIYVEDICLGYYYFEFSMDDGFELYKNIGSKNLTAVTTTSIAQSVSKETYQRDRDDIIKHISNYLSCQIDTNFVNANQDLSKEIYAILKHNDLYNNINFKTHNIRVTFLPEEDVTQLYFNMDDITHRGISDLIGSLVPAKLYACLYIGNTLGILTRGQDKRVYYVKQNVETNISQTLLNVINQIKKGNFGIRQIENMNNLLNITGRYNDYIIPVGQSGDAPIQFEVMQGQDINPQTELMDKLEELSIGPTDVPLDLIQARLSMDFASEITMHNAKFMRHVFDRQSQFEVFLSKIITKLYNSEYNDNKKIKVSLPTPMFLNMSNLQSILENTRNVAVTLGELEYDYDQNMEGKEERKGIFVKKFIRSRLNGYIKINELDTLKTEADVEYDVMIKKSQESEDSNV